LGNIRGASTPGKGENDPHGMTWEKENLNVLRDNGHRGNSIMGEKEKGGVRKIGKMARTPIL